MKPHLVPKKKEPRNFYNLCDENFDALLEEIKPYMSDFQINMAKKSTGDYTSEDKAREAHKTACDHMHDGLMFTLSKLLKAKFKDRHDELHFALGIVSRIKEFE